jgi:hypothetical protein
MSVSTDESLNEKYRELCCAVGNLFITFGRLEGTLSAILRLHLANNFAEHLSDHEGVALSGAIYGSMRFKAARDTLRRLAKAEGTTEKTNAFLDDVFGQIGHIENLRDKIAHQTVIPVPDEHATPDEYWQVSDQTVTRDIKKLKIYVFNTDAIIAAAQDLVTSAACLGNYSQGKKLFESVVPEPVSWRYKPSMLKHVRLGTARTRL